MPIPDYQTLMLPILRLAGDADELSARDCVASMCDRFGLSEAEREELLPSGKQTTIANRTHWAITYLVQAGLLDRPKRGVVTPTAEGRAVLARNPQNLDNRDLMAFESFRQFRSRGRTGRVVESSDDAEAETVGDAGTPEERIEAAYEELNADLKTELLARIMQASPVFFEHLIIDLMLAMGYGGSGSGRHLGRSSDGGVDGIINEDPLGLDLVFLQAKRYAAHVGIGVEKIREFAGSLDERGAVKGVFVTTSYFAGPAETYAERSPKRLILIDGERLTQLMVRYGVGVRAFRSFDLKRLDADYFNEE